MKPPSKWEHILEHGLKPKAIDAQLVDEAAKLLAKELEEEFPPEVGELEGEAARFKPLFEAPRTRPGDDVFRAAFQLARLELLREYDELDLYMKQERYRPLAPSERDRLAMLFLARWLTEQLYTLKEQLQTPLSRARLAEIVEQTERRLLGARH